MVNRRWRPILPLLTTLIASLFWLLLLNSSTARGEVPAVASLSDGGCDAVSNTPSFTIAYGQAQLDGSAAPVGTVVEALNPRGDAVGCFVISESGYYGAMYVYGEDNSVTPSIPGMRNGETIAFEIEGGVATVTPTLTWQNDRALHEVDLSANLPVPAAVSDLSIVRSSSGITLTWSAVTTNVSGGSVTVDHYNIYRSSSPYFSPLAENLLGQVAGNLYADPDILADLSTYYYLVTAVSDGDKESTASSHVGKFAIEVVPGWTLAAWPLLPGSIALDDVIGDQLYGTHDPATADRILIWDPTTQTYDSAWYCAGETCESYGTEYANHWLAGDYSQSTLTTEPDTGFWIENRSSITETLSVVGTLAETSRSVPIGSGWQLLGSAFPIEKSLDNSGLPAIGDQGPLSADRVLIWDTNSQLYESAWYCGGLVCESWGEPYANHWLTNDYSPSDINIVPGYGFWFFNRHDPTTWINSASVP